MAFVILLIVKPPEFELLTVKIITCPPPIINTKFKEPAPAGSGSFQYNFPRPSCLYKR
ncbi:hypothetical protein CLOSTMETH_03272 [[Clostridium] methylpentosum DSM 5476]|uniref:Uncharacterized protein n=1 Tax=[Clostridium] methylpentosum DSM 5476 TaxID=537013 RepID=C0EH73_9FIRM|nr:hypothetical protein CLOSTMETH_03272 [[Clostridium] methylpentosum DSM 5476]